MSRPETITLSAAAGEAIIERLSVYAPSRSDCEILIQVLRWYFWLAAAIKEAKLSLKKPHSIAFRGKGATTQRKPPEVRIRRLRNQSAVGMRPPSTSTPHCPACLARHW
jgi:hypothetical protein